MGQALSQTPTAKARRRLADGDAVEYLVVGAGPAGLQAAYFLKKFGLDHAVVDAADGPGSFFRKYPVGRQLISINKRHLPDLAPLDEAERADFALRHDWNSLLSDERAPLMRDFSEAHALDVVYGAKALSVDRRAGGGFDVRIGARGAEVTIRAQIVLVAAGLAKQAPPDLPWAAAKHVDYGDFGSDPGAYAGLNVGVLGGGNSAFEVAGLLRDYAAQTYVIPRTDPEFAHESHYPGAARPGVVVRSRHLGFLDQFYLKSMDALLPPKYANGVLPSEKAHHDHELAPRPQRAPPGGCSFYGLKSAGRAAGPFFDVVVNCTGFKSDLGFLAGVLPEVPDKYPPTTPFYESRDAAGLYFLGALMHGRDARRSSGGFVHGFRYLVRSALTKLRCDRHGARWPRTDIAVGDFGAAALRRASSASAPFQCFGVLCDLYAFSGDAVARFDDVPVAAAPEDVDAALAPDFYVRATFEYGRHWRGPNAVRHGSALTPVAVRRPLAFADRAALLAWLDDEAISRVYRVGADGADVLVNELVHPVFRFYDGAGALRDVLHVDEELAVFFLYRKHRASALFLDAVVDDLRRGRDDRALGHVLLEPGDGGLRVRVDAYE
ncbi:hypothetical protein AURANDRAFT_67457 [Aureococcus anophagefferens]|uniref:FAD/NAD(P)-binding domain-containing protein n=1 Tax=Aureococcus anophagefferens TaxID=44056 RepID=F0YL82_AURAN|nr:hypothetical protein AURANDRAFT_67457 [Aureococcus anophagefferens]EGB04158.1 hypothetical protein AURANDRAFT_67457 [Aureococcus anophagefferens]|eukprot:XP_009041144.1 hypothetical protein AURANDRAFT_67457 [Aureococcus anophagefferens]